MSRPTCRTPGCNRPVRDPDADPVNADSAFCLPCDAAMAWAYVSWRLSDDRKEGPPIGTELVPGIEGPPYIAALTAGAVVLFVVFLVLIGYLSR